MKKLILVLLIAQGVFINGNTHAQAIQRETPSIFYVDSNNGNDNNSGDIDNPFQSLDKALELVGERANKGIRSDKIYLRAGRYKKVSASTLYRLELKGTQDDFAELSAMPREPNAPGAVQRKSGNWYEKVVFDDAYIIDTPWEKVPGDKNIWKTSPGFTLLEWTHQNLWPWTRTEKGFPLTKNDDTPETTQFTVAPYMLMQDGEPTIWMDDIESITEPGMRTYDHQTGELFVFPYEDKNPNNSTWESWYGGPEDFEIGTLHLDGEGRALFDGNMEFAAIRGFEFYMFNKVFEFHRRKYDKESERVIQRNVLLEDNLFRYGWIHILLDGNTVNQKQKDIILPRYHDRFAWTARNNVFYRPSRECFQLHGDNHVFEYNDIIEHLGPWAGPAACVSAVNTRNTRNALIRNNYIVGHGNNRYRNGSVFMIEVGGPAGDRAGSHKTEEGDYTFGGQTYENNLLVDIKGPAMVLGKGGVRMRNITVRNNIFKKGNGAPAIQLSSAHMNLTIENNIFYDQQVAIALAGGKNYLEFYQSVPSVINITNNIFSQNQKTIDKQLFSPYSSSKLNIGNNLFYRNGQEEARDGVYRYDPMFRAPERLDFRPAPGVTIMGEFNFPGPYPVDGSFMLGLDWWNRSHQQDKMKK